MLILVRHGESVANAQGLLLGRTDAELTEHGRAQAAAVPSLLERPVVELRTSPLSRAADTAQLLELELPAVVDDRWIEVDYGEFECQPLGDIPAEVWQKWQGDRDFCPAGGESLTEVDVRIAGACEELFAADGSGARRADGDVVVVSHVTPIKAAVAWALGTPDLYWRLYLRTASVTRISWNRNAPILHGFNEVALAPGRPGRHNHAVPETPPTVSTVAALRPPPDSDEEPVHRRTIGIDVFLRDEHFVVIGTLTDVRPWASGTLGPRDLHSMELAIVVRRADLMIVDAVAEMKIFPHAECTDIEPKFSELIGLSVARGYTSAVQERFGRERGCSHLEFLAHAIGPAVVQSVTSSAAWQVEHGDPYPMGERGLTFLSNTCHVFIDEGPGVQKIATGWRPGMFGYPAPTVDEIRRRIAAGESGDPAVSAVR